MALPSSPNTRKEMYLSNMAGQGTALPSEPITREEEYLDFIAKNGGGGGGTGDGDMKKSVYDNDLDVAGAGGIKSYVTGAVSGKVDKVTGKGLSTNDYTSSEKTKLAGLSNYDDTAITGRVSTIEGKIPEGASSSNQLVTRILLENSLTDKVDKTSVGANNGVAGLDSTGRVPSSQLPSYVDDVLEYASISAFPATGETGKIYIALDTNKTYRWSGSAYVEISESLALGETASTAYAGNKGKANADAIAAMKDGTNIDSFGDVETALAEKVDKVTGKGLSTNDYDNTAKGIVDKIQSNVIANTKLIKDTVGWSGKNLLRNDATSTPNVGINVTVNSDGTVSLGAGTTSGSFYKIIQGGFADSEVPLPSWLEKGKSYIISDGVNGTIPYMGIWFYDSNKQPITGFPVYQNTFTVPNNAAYYLVAIYMPSNTTISATTVYPMITDADVLDQSYEPYFGSTAFPRSEQAVLGAKNILKYPYTQDSWTTAQGLSGTVNSDGSITLSAESLSADTSITIHGRAGQTDRNPMILPKGKYTISKNIVNNVRIEVVDTVSGAKHVITSLGVSETKKTFELSEDTQVGIQIISATGATTISGTLYLMIRLASDPDDTYVPYAMTNRELTDAVHITTVQNIDLNTIIKEGEYRLNGGLTNAPNFNYGYLTVKEFSGSNSIEQIATSKGIADKIYRRIYDNNAWSSWYAFTGTVVS